MSSRLDLDRRLADWFNEEAPDRAPDHLVVATNQLLDKTGQLGGIPGVPRRFIRMNPSWRLAGAAAVLVAALGMTLWFLGSIQPTVVGGPTASSSVAPPSPSAAPTPTVSKTAAPTPVFRPASLGLPVRIDLPRGWRVDTDSTDLTVLLPPTPVGDSLGQTPLYSVVGLYNGPVANLLLDDRSTTTTPKDAHAIATWLGTLPFIEATTPAAVTLAGKSGFMVDVSLPGSPKPKCGAGACEALLTSQPLDRFEFGVVGSEKARLFFLDLPDGTVLMVTIDAASGTDFDEVVSVAMPVVESLTFEGP